MKNLSLIVLLSWLFDRELLQIASISNSQGIQQGLYLNGITPTMKATLTLIKEELYVIGGSLCSEEPSDYFSSVTMSDLEVCSYLWI